ncbi:MAG: YggS family pyridoxal phosphate-dependent enzyme [Candidatus Omnitrophica bacterium]|nr:YggS family pyridoxal phosphate-dependent enzyme [Candidatus Omnitrophota bacterium]
MGPAELGERIAAVHRRIANACQRRGRNSSTVTVVAVTKGVGAVGIQEAVACGLTHLGENRVQEAREKQRVLGSGVKWHLIGHLQRNKAKEAVELFETIHSLDSSALAETLERHAAAADREVEVFIQVNVSGEATKFGCRPDDAPALGARVTQLPHLRLRGLMTIAPFADDPETVRPIFYQLRGLRDEVTSSLRLPPATFCLSMGMSQDFEVAIEEGADVVRIGTAIFGTSS